MEVAAGIIAETIRQAGYRLDCDADLDGHSKVIVTSGRNGREWCVVGENELEAMTEMTRRLLFEDSH